MDIPGSGLEANVYSLSEGDFKAKRKGKRFSPAV